MARTKVDRVAQFAKADVERTINRGTQTMERTKVDGAAQTIVADMEMTMHKSTQTVKWIVLHRPRCQTWKLL